MKNFWLNQSKKKKALQEINFLLKKFQGRKINPIDALFQAMKKCVIKYFKQHPDQLKYFVDENLDLNIDFDIEENAGIVVSAKMI